MKYYLSALIELVILLAVGAFFSHVLNVELVLGVLLANITVSIVSGAEALRREEIIKNEVFKTYQNIIKNSGNKNV